MTNRTCPACNAEFKPRNSAQRLCSRVCSSTMRAARYQSRENITARFLSHVDQSGDCWIWRGDIGTGGYGYFNVARKSCRAHRYAYELFVGPIPDGLVLDHLCRVRECVRPEHLRPVTTRENLMAPGSLAPAKVQATQTHCQRGHEFTPENTLRQWSGARACRACSRLGYHRRKAAASSLQYAARADACRCDDELAVIDRQIDEGLEALHALPTQRKVTDG